MNPENPPVPAVTPAEAVLPSAQPPVQPQPEVGQVSKPKVNMVMILIIVLVLAALGGGGYLFKDKLLTMLNIGSLTQKNQAQTTEAKITPNPAEATPEPETQLDRDIQNLNNKINNVDTDMSNATRGLNDQPIPPAE